VSVQISYLYKTAGAHQGRLDHIPMGRCKVVSQVYPFCHFTFCHSHKSFVPCLYSFFLHFLLAPLHAVHLPHHCDILHIIVIYGLAKSIYIHLPSLYVS
jgi:hypothetical protein